MSLVDKKSTGVAAPAIQLATEVAARLDTEVAANKVLYDANPGTYAGLPWTRDEYVNAALLDFFP